MRFCASRTYRHPLTKPIVIQFMKQYSSSVMRSI
jgi:hypothetical protein